jgi:PAS domain S-box-containing protein
MEYQCIFDILGNADHGASGRVPGKNCELVEVIMAHLQVGLALLSCERFDLAPLNRRFEVIVGCGQRDCRDLPRLLTHLIPDAELCRQMIDLVCSEIRSGDATKMAWDIPAVRDGREVSLLFRATPLADKAQLLIWVEDITERKHLSESEEQFHALVDQASDSFFLMDARGALLDVNPAACKGLGYSREELLGLKISDIDPGFSADQHIDRYWEPLQRGDPVIFEAQHMRKDGSTFPVEVVLGMVKLSTGKRFLGIHRDLTWRKRAEVALKCSEERRYKLQVELDCAAEMQRNLLPAAVPLLDDFELAARCRPAQHVAGDFYDWQCLNTQTLMVTLGDVMGKGLAAAMLMATVRSVLRGVARKNRPERALYLAEKALYQDLDRSDSFVTLFYSHLDLKEKRLDYVDCGHGHAFLRRSDGSVEELLPRDLPLGVPGKEARREGCIVFSAGDALILYSDGLPDALPGLNLDYAALAQKLDGAKSADEMLERLTGLVPESVAAPDDLTVLVVFCKN